MRGRQVVARFLGAPVLAIGVGVACLWPVVAHARGTTLVADARQVYLRDCASCHGADGRGTSKGPSLAGQGEAGVDFMLTTGRMPAPNSSATQPRRRPAYAPEMIAALDRYVGRLVPGGPAIPVVDSTGADLGAGGVIYRDQCAACHQAAGAGGALLGQFSPSLRPSTPVQVAEAVRTGPGTMPVFGATAVPEAQLASLAAYVAALQHTPDPGGVALGHLGPLAEGAVGLAGMGVVLLALRRIGTRT